MARTPRPAGVAADRAWFLPLMVAVLVILSGLPPHREPGGPSEAHPDSPGLTLAAENESEEVTRNYYVTPRIHSMPATEGALFFSRTYSLTWNLGERIYLARNHDGSGEMSVDGAITLEVTHSDGTSSSWFERYDLDENGLCQPLHDLGAKDLTQLFNEGINEVHIRFNDTCGNLMGASPHWLVVKGHPDDATCTNTVDYYFSAECAVDPVNTLTGAFVSSSTDLRMGGTGVPFRLDRSYDSSRSSSGAMGQGWRHSFEAGLAVWPNGDVSLTNEAGQRVIYGLSSGTTCALTGGEGTFSSLAPTYPATSAANYAEEVLADNPRAFWRFGETSGSTLTDSSSNALHGSYLNAPILGDATALRGPTNASVFMNGMDEYATVSDSSLIEFAPGQNFTVELWARFPKIQPAPQGTTADVLEKWHGSGGFPYSLRIVNQNGSASVRGRLRAFRSDGANSAGIISSKTLNDGIYHHILFVKRGTTLELWLDGQLDGTITDTATGTTTNPYPLYIARRGGTEAKYASANVDDLSIYGSALSTARIQAHYGWGCRSYQGFELIRSDQSVLGFDGAGRLTRVEDRNGEGLTVARDAGGRVASVTDSAGRAAIFGYDAAGRLTSVTLPDGRSVSYGYTDGRMSFATDARNATTTYTYNSNGRLQTIVDPLEHTMVENTYGASGRVVSQIDALGKESFFDWDDTTKTATLTDAEGHEWTYVYMHDALVQETDPLGNSTQYGYTGGYRTSVTDALEHTTTMTYDSRGNLLTRTPPSPLSYVETFTYDTQNNLLTHEDGREHTTSYGYDSAGNLVEVERPGGLTTEIERDASGRPTAVTDPRGKTTTFEYDLTGNLTTITSAEGSVTSIGYDLAGRPISVVDPRGNELGAIPADYLTLVGYDATDHVVSVTDPLGNVWEREYDLGGNLTGRTDPEGNTTSFEYDAVHQLVSVTGADLAETSYTYDDVGNLVLRTDPNDHGTSYTYDAARRMTSLTAPPGRTWDYEYDAAGNLSEVVTALGTSTQQGGDGTISLGYDELNRLSSIGYSDVTPDVAFAYDANGNRISMTDGAGTASYTYDSLDRLVSVLRGSEEVEYVYDAAGNVTSRSFPGAASVDYTYDDDSRLASVSWAGGQVDYAYDAAGHLTTTSFPASSGLSESREYDGAGRLTLVENTLDSNMVSSFAYTRDGVGNPLTVETLDGIENYEYDPVGRLLEVCYAASCSGQTDPFIRYTYDDVGNRLTESRPAGTTTYTYDQGDRITSTDGPAGLVTFNHDANGNLTSAGAKVFAYNLANQLIAATIGGSTTSYEYDGDGTRTEASTDTPAAVTRYLWDVNGALPMLVSERDGQGDLDRRYTRGHSLLGLQTPTDSSLYLRDGLGNVVGVAAADGDAQWSYAYEPFGSLRQETQGSGAPPVNLMRFSGELFDLTPGLYHLRARLLDTGTGRFLQPDPLAPPMKEAAVGTYAYVWNRPTVFVDPSGRRGEFTGSNVFDSINEEFEHLPEVFANWGKAAGAVALGAGAVALFVGSGGTAGVIAGGLGTAGTAFSGIGTLQECTMVGLNEACVRGFASTGIGIISGIPGHLGGDAWDVFWGAAGSAGADWVL